MERVGTNSNFDVWLSTIDTVDDFALPFEGEYALLLIINRTDTGSLEQEQLSDKIVESRCRYALCFGHECSTWDDSIDYSFICTDPAYDPPDSRFVMTTWHEDDPIDDVVFQLRYNTTFDDFVPDKFLVVFVGENDDLMTLTLQSLRHHFCDEVN